LAEVTAFGASLAFVTAEALSCAVPTLFLGTCRTVAYPVPPRATPRAMHAITRAGDGRRRRSFLIVYLRLGDWRGAADRTSGS
jgi:hypothetical protein